MSEYRLSRLAREDLRDIATRIAEDDPARAAIFIEALLAKIEWVAANPRLYRSRTNGEGGMRLARHQRYFIMFAAGDQQVEILRVIPTSRDLDAILDDIQ